MAQKYIINENEILMANVEFHREILKDNKNTVGGGYWYFQPLLRVWFFYSKSEDFGSISYETFKNALKNHWDDELIEAPKCFHNAEFLSGALKDYEEKESKLVFDEEINCWHKKLN